MLVVLNSLFRILEITFPNLNFMNYVFILLVSNHRQKWATQFCRVYFPYHNSYTIIIYRYAFCSLMYVLLLRYYLYL